MSPPPSMKGFTVTPADAWWVSCDQCDETEMVFGTTADIEAVTWATAHVNEVHAGGSG